MESETGKQSDVEHRTTSSTAKKDNQIDAKQSKSAVGKGEDAITAREKGKENHEGAMDSNERICFKCKRSLAKSHYLINVTGRLHRWHAECFICEICSNPLDKESSCHTYKDKIVCRDDYFKLQRDNSVKCARCRWPIGASDWVRRAAQLVYHLACFTCDICQRQLNTGEQFTIKGTPDDEIKLLCRLHFAIDTHQAASQKQAVTSGNNDTSKGGGVRSASPNHSESLELLDNGPPSDNSGDNQDSRVGATPRNSLNPILQQHGIGAFERRQMGPKGRFCEETDEQQRYLNLLASSSDPVSAQAFHHRPSFEDETVLNNLGPSLRDDNLAASRATCSPTTSSVVALDHQHLHPHLPHQAQQHAASNSSSSSGSNASGRGALTPVSSKSKRVRTTFTEDQLFILQTHFQIDSNPDGQDLERIATITGLSKRVTQVWFQNSRARQKKYLIKRKPIPSNQPTAATSSTNVTGEAGTNSSVHPAHHQFGCQPDQQQQRQHALDLQTDHTPAAGGYRQTPMELTSQQKWSATTSDRSELSHSGTPLDDFEDSSRSSSSSNGRQLILTEDSGN